MKTPAIAYSFLVLTIIGWLLLMLPTLSEGSHIRTYLDTPTPSFDPEIREKFLALLLIDKDCLFPCWQGLTLGESSIEDARELGGEIFDDRGDHTLTDIYQPYDFFYKFEYLPGNVADGTAVWLKVVSNVDTFSALNIGYVGFDTSTNTEVLPNGYLVENIVEAYGPPDEIWLLGAPYTFITLVYNTHGILIEYDRIETRTDYEVNMQIICPEDFVGFDLTAYVPGELDLTPFYADRRQLDDTSELSSEEFVDLITDRDISCIETPLSIWGIPDADSTGAPNGNSTP